MSASDNKTIQFSFNQINRAKKYILDPKNKSLLKDNASNSFLLGISNTTEAVENFNSLNITDSSLLKDKVLPKPEVSKESAMDIFKQKISVLKNIFLPQTPKEENISDIQEKNIANTDYVNEKEESKKDNTSNDIDEWSPM